jgi:antitoxin FitA
VRESLARSALDMCFAWTHVWRMSRMIQIRNVPDDVHKALKIRATKEGMSLSDYLLREVTKVAGTLTVQEVVERAARRGPVELDEDPVDTIRRLRGPLP